MERARRRPSGSGGPHLLAAMVGWCAMHGVFYKIGARIASALATVVLLLALAQPLSAGTLEGQVVGADNLPRPDLRIDLFGPQKRVTVTDQEGRFKVKVRGGAYRIRISEHPRQTEQRVSIPKSGSAKQRFKVNW